MKQEYTEFTQAEIYENLDLEAEFIWRNENPELN